MVCRCIHCTPVLTSSSKFVFKLDFTIKYFLYYNRESSLNSQIAIKQEIFHLIFLIKSLISQILK